MVNYSLKFTLLLLLLSSSLAQAQLKLPHLISEGLVLQREQPNTLWGWANPHETVRVSLQQKTYSAQSNTEGKWQIKIPAQKASGPFEIHIESGSEQLKVKDVFFGDFWLCSGQSNMELPLSRVIERYPTVLSEVNPQIRQFTVPDRYVFEAPQENLSGGYWMRAQGEDLAKFSALGYFFAQEVYKTTGVAIGLVNAALGGSPIEAWLSKESIKAFPEALKAYEEVLTPGFVNSALAKNKEIQTNWYQSLNEKDPGLNQTTKWYESNMSLKSWDSLQLPFWYKNSNLSQHIGSVWFQKEIELGEEQLKGNHLLRLGRVMDKDETYINGVKVGEITYQYPPRRYVLQKGILKAGKNRISVRVTNTAERGGFFNDKPYFLITKTDSIPLSGYWKYKKAAEMPPIEATEFIRWRPVGLYHQMISPLKHLPFKVVLWYQGESNADAPVAYAKKMKYLISDWRSLFQNNSLPFFTVQLANYKSFSADPQESSWAELRLEQHKASSTNSNVFIASAMDLGEWNDIHPLAKKELGQRMAKQALSHSYNIKGLKAHHPFAIRATTKKNTVVIKIQTDSNLIAKKSLEQSFSIADKSGDFKWVSATLVGNEVHLKLPKDMQKPIRVRYAHADNPKSSIYSESGLPLLAFELLAD